MIDIAIMDYSTCEVILLKVDERIVEHDFNNDVEAYIKSPTVDGGLGFDLDDCYYMCGEKIRVICPNGSPEGGMEIGCDAMH